MNVLRRRNVANAVVAQLGVQNWPARGRDQLLGLCARVAYGALNCIKGFGLGVAAAGIMTPLSHGVGFLAQKIGLIQEMGDRASLMKEQVANMAKMGFRFDAEALANATCPMQEYVTQFNSLFPFYPEVHQTVFSVKAAMVGGFGVLTPIFEEVIFRGLVQDILMKRIPQYIVKKIAPGREMALDSRIAGIVRIVLTSALFSAYHLLNRGIFANAYVDLQIVQTFIMGISLGIFKESKAGLFGAMGAHMAHNIIAISPQLLSC